MRKWGGSVKGFLVGGGLGGRRAYVSLQVSSELYIVGSAKNGARPDVFVVDTNLGCDRGTAIDLTAS